MATKILTYDIPSAINFPNPSALLRRRAIRFNLSCWIMDESRVPWNLVNEMRAAGIQKVYVVPGFDTADADAQRLMLDAITDDIRKQQARDLVALRKSDERLAAAEVEANGVMTRELLVEQARHRKHRESVLKGTAKLLKDLEFAMDLYHLDRQQAPFAAARSQINGIRALNGAQASLYAQMTNAVQGTEMAAAAANDEVPAGILADYVDDQGHGALAARAHQAFAPAARNGHAHPAAAPLPNNAPAANRQPVHYEVSRNGRTNQCDSTLTTVEAATICRDLPSTEYNTFPRDLGRRYLRGNARFSTIQIAWMHILATRSVGDQQEQTNGHADAAQPASVVAPAAAQVTAPKAPEPITPPAAPAPVVVDDTVSGEQTEVPVISTDKAGLVFAAKVFTISETATGLSGLPRWVDLKSHKTGKLVRFTRRHEDWHNDADGEGSLVATVYAGPDGLTLRILND